MHMPHGNTSRKKEVTSLGHCQNCLFYPYLVPKQTSQFSQCLVICSWGSAPWKTKQWLHYKYFLGTFPPRVRHKRAWITWAHFVLFPRKALCYTITTWPRASPQWNQKPFSAHHLRKCSMCGQGFKNSCNCSSRSFTTWAQLVTLVRGTGTFKN